MLIKTKKCTNIRNFEFFIWNNLERNVTYSFFNENIVYSNVRNKGYCNALPEKNLIKISNTYFILFFIFFRHCLICIIYEDNGY